MPAEPFRHGAITAMVISKPKESFNMNSSKNQELMSLPGATATGSFSPTGQLLSYAGNINEQAAEIAALMSAANQMMGNMQAKGWSSYTQEGGFFPIQGFAVAGGKHVACVMGGTGVFMEMDKADFDKAFAVLSRYA